MLLMQIAECALTRRSPQIGDPSVVGWLTVAAYLIASALALATATKRGQRRAERTFWLLSGAGLLFLAINKQLDLQSFLTAFARCMAELQGWYGSRRLVQLGFILVLMGAAVGVGVAGIWALRHTFRRTAMAILGLVWITTFVLIRAIGFHHVDLLIGIQLGGLRLNWLFELGGIAIFTLGCLLALATSQRARVAR